MLHIFLDVASYLGSSLQAVCHFFASLTSFHSNLLFCDIIFGDYVLEHLFISVPVCLDFLKSQSIYQVVPEKVVEAVLQACRSGNFDFANKEVNNFIAEGYPASQMLTQLFEAIVEENDLSDEQKARISKKLGEADKCLVDGADEYLQLLAVVSNTMKAFSNIPEEFAYEC
ncbi:replication factor C subunit 2/4 [Vigna unguiculata]|uniref:Replication factor C subunit 2/4 n=1 Tax=Vigna unguiculata TaxID=3917 RepID=A0A4D6NPD4_VIGUN|nr:replication factor C subunit 2/4 [Vigna unguiculata]